MGVEVASEALAEAVLADEAAKSRRLLHRHGLCANCGLALRGPFCHACGQAAHVHRSLLHLVEETLHGIFHFDSKIGRTLPALLLRPGRLTRDYIEGKRVRYVSPLALFLFLIFLTFFVFSLTGAGENRPDPTRPAVQITVKGAEQSPTPALVQAQLRKYLPWLATPAVEKKIVHAIENRELMAYKIRASAVKFAILLVPISLPFLWLLFLTRRQHSMFDHTVFVLYSLSAMALLMMPLAVLDLFAWELAAALWATLVLPLHMFAQLRGSYGLSFWAAAWRTLALLMIACITISAYAVLLVLVSL